MHLQQNLIPACKRRMKCHRNAFFQFLPDGAGCGISPLFRNRQKNREITVWNISAVQRLPENIICVNPRKREKKWFRVFVSCPERKAAFSVKAPLHQIVRLTIRQPFCLAAAHAVKHVSRLCKSGCRGKRTHTVIEAENSIIRFSRVVGDGVPDRPQTFRISPHQNRGTGKISRLDCRCAGCIVGVGCQIPAQLSDSKFVSAAVLTDESDNIVHPEEKTT